MLRVQTATTIMTRTKTTTTTYPQVIGATATATVVFWLGGPLAGVIVVALLLFVALVCIPRRCCWSSIHPANHLPDGRSSSNSNAESLLDDTDKTHATTTMSLDEQKHATDIEMAHKPRYSAPQTLDIPTATPAATSAPGAATTGTKDMLPSNSPPREPLQLAEGIENNKRHTDESQSDRMGSEDSSLLLGCAISSPSSTTSTEGANDHDPTRGLESLPEQGLLPPAHNSSRATHSNVGSTTDEEHYYASDEYSTSSDEQHQLPSTNSASTIDSQSSNGPSSMVTRSDTSTREESLGTLFATSSSEEEPSPLHRIQRPRLPTFGKARPPSSHHPKVMPRGGGGTPKAAAASSDSDLDTISGNSI